MTARSIVLLTTARKSSARPRSECRSGPYAMPTPNMNERTSADITSHTGGIATEKYGAITVDFSTAAFVSADSIIPGKSTEPVPYARSDARTVSKYAIAAVTTSSLPAPRPTSPIAGVTSPIIMSGTTNPMNWLNTPLNVAKNRMTPIGITRPSSIPRMIATIMRGSNPIFFIIYLPPDVETICGRLQ